MSAWREPVGAWRVVGEVATSLQDAKKLAGKAGAGAILNSVVIHENVEVTGPTRSSTYTNEKSTGPLMLQGDHGPVAYRNIRIRPLSALPIAR